jgi:hypothetical protein
VQERSEVGDPPLFSILFLQRAVCRGIDPSATVTSPWGFLGWHEDVREAAPGPFYRGWVLAQTRAAM